MPFKIRVPGFLAPLWFSGFLLLLVLLPLPFGGNRPWASDLFAVLIGGLLVALLWTTHGDPFGSFSGTSMPRRRLFFAGGGVSLVILWSFLQTASWMPAAWHHPMWQEAATLLGDVQGSIALDPGVFPEALVRLLAYIGCFLLAFYAGRDRVKAVRLVRVLAYAGCAYAVYGLLAKSAGGDTILWFKKWAYHGFLTSTFVNKNSYATYAGLGFLCSLAVLRDHLRAVVIDDPVLAKQNKIIAYLSALKVRDYLAFLPSLLILAALAFTGSRAGVVSLFVGLLAFGLSLAVHRRLNARQWFWIVGSFFGIVLVFIVIGGSFFAARMSHVEGDGSTRLAGYQLAAQAIADNPWLGFGLGGFESAFRLYRDETLPLWYHHAHNDYLEMMMDLGVPVALMLFAALAALVSCCVTGLWKRKKDGIYPALAIGASALVAAHSLVDFGMHIPAIAATYAALLGLGVAQSWSTRKA